jgi:mono/diheme cytochrome c family protein
MILSYHPVLGARFSSVTPRTRPLCRALMALTFGLGLTYGNASEPARAAPAAVGARHAKDMALGLELFKREVRDLLIEHCVRCHGGKRVQSKFDLSTRKGLLAGGKVGPAVVARAARQSRLYRLVTHAEEPHMPHNKERLSEEQVAALARWIDLGAPYDKPLVTEEQGSAAVVDDEDRAFWSFQPLVRPPVPPLEETATVVGNGWCRGPIDRFVFEKLAEHGLHPSVAASRRRLIRRLYFDVIGLPPTPEAVAGFVADPAPDAFDRLVDRLLADPRFGERWGRHWLDLARFAESHGFEHDTVREYAYHYRDFVIRAFNSDLPYDEFVQWQLAGDELAPDRPDAMAATGFLAAGVHATQITANQVEKERYDELDDMANTLGTSMLGLSIGCARCHDHKYYPIPTRDYYRFLSTFTTTIRSDHDVVVNAPEYRAALEQFFVTHRPYEQALADFERDELPTRFSRWLAAGDFAPEAFGWSLPELVKTQSQVGAEFERLPDGSILVVSNNGIKDTYTFTFDSRLASITGVRIDALAHGALPGGGPGRGEGGKFAFNRLSVTAQPLSKAAAGVTPVAVAADTGNAPQPVVLEFGTETFVEGGAPIEAKGQTSDRINWVVTEFLGRTHTLLIRFPEPVKNEHGTRLVFELGFRREYQGNMGRPRISLSGAATLPGVESGVVPERHRDTLGRVAAGGGDALDAERKKDLQEWYRVIDPRWRELESLRQNHLGTQPRPKTEKMLISSEGVAPLRLNTQGADFFEETYFLNRGDPNQKLGVAQQSFLQVLTRSDEVPLTGAASLWQEPPPEGSRLSYRRRALARWITDVERGAGNLLSRVAVNRLWQYLMGRGIVATPSDFGAQGERPSHPELLETLAVELTENGWRLKPLLRRLLTTAVYRQSAAADPERARKDPVNHWFWRRTPRRLEAEIVRDALLGVSDTLEPRMYGPGTLDEDHRRRSIYFLVRRSKLVPMMTVFDAPDALQGIPTRPVTTVAPQALYLLNSPVVQRASLFFAQRLEAFADSPEAAVDAAYEIALARPPRRSELEAALAFVAQQEASYEAAGREVPGKGTAEPGTAEPGASRRQALADLCQTIVSLNEFIYVD